MKREDLSKIMSEAHQFIKIAGIGLSEALKKAWANFKLRLQMGKGIVKFYFQKIDGSIREAYGTLSEKLIPTTIAGEKRAKNANVQTYWDTERQEWRCFKKLNLMY